MSAACCRKAALLPLAIRLANRRRKCAVSATFGASGTAAESVMQLCLLEQRQRGGVASPQRPDTITPLRTANLWWRRFWAHAPGKAGRLQDNRIDFGRRHDAVMVSFTLATRALSAKGLARKANCSF